MFCGWTVRSLDRWRKLTYEFSTWYQGRRQKKHLLFGQPDIFSDAFPEITAVNFERRMWYETIFPKRLFSPIGVMHRQQAEACVARALVPEGWLTWEKKNTIYFQDIPIKYGHSCPQRTEWPQNNLDFIHQRPPSIQSRKSTSLPKGWPITMTRYSDRLTLVLGNLKKNYLGAETRLFLVFVVGDLLKKEIISFW